MARRPWQPADEYRDPFSNQFEDDWDNVDEEYDETDEDTEDENEECDDEDCHEDEDF